MPKLDRRRILQLFGASAALQGCDRVDVDVQQKPGPADADGLRPITPNDYFYVYEHSDPPENYDVDGWTATITAGGQTATLTPAFFAERDAIPIEYTLQCIGGNPRNTLINNAVWGGWPFRAVLEDLGIDIPPGTVELVMVGADGVVDNYSTSVPIADVVEERVWLVWEMNDEPLPFAHGAPCRFLIIDRYGTKNVKWPIEIALVDTPHTGYWESRAWSVEANYRVNGFIFNPADRTEVPPGELIYGTAYAGSDPVTEVDISFDMGATWSPTEVYYAPGADRWALWRYTYDGPTGEVRARIRVRTASGDQTDGVEVMMQSQGYNGGMEVQFEVVE